MKVNDLRSLVVTKNIKSIEEVNKLKNDLIKILQNN